MTIEQKAKCYDDALKMAKKLYEQGTITESLAYIFPELAESEDEKIRKGIISYLKLRKETSPSIPAAIGSWIVWLENFPYFIDHEKREGFHLGYKAGLEKQGEKQQKTPIWKHWKDGIAGNGEGKPIYLIKYGHTYSLSSCLCFECDYIKLSELDKLMLEKQETSYTKRDVDDAYLKGISDAKNELEKQGDSPIKWNKNTEGNKPQVNHSVLMKTTHGIAEGEWIGEGWLQYRWSSRVKDRDVIAWAELSDLEKQGEKRQKQYDIDVLEKHITKDSISELAHTVIVRNGWEIVDAKEQKPVWSKEDEKELNSCIEAIEACYKWDTMVDWLKSLKKRIGGKL